MNALDELRKRFPKHTEDKLKEMLKNLQNQSCPDCGGKEWFPGAACWDCEFEMP